MRTLLGLLVLASPAWLSGCATTHRSMASNPWLEVKTTHFRILTDAPPEKAVRSAIELERYRRALLLLWSPDANPEDITDVAMLRDGVEHFAHFERHRVFVFSADQFLGRPSKDVLVHELAHLVTRMVAERPPRWLSEGISSYLETVRISPTGEVVFGGPNRHSMEWLSNVPLMDLDRLWTWSPVDRGEIGRYHAAAWGLCHYLISEKPQELAVMMRELAAGREGREAWRVAFGDVPLSAYRPAVRDYLARRRWQLLTTRLPPVREAPSVRHLGPGEGRAVSAWLHAIDRRQEDMAIKVANVRRELDEARRLEPDGPLVKELTEWSPLVDRMADWQAREQAGELLPEEAH